MSAQRKVTADLSFIHGRYSGYDVHLERLLDALEEHLADGPRERDKELIHSAQTLATCLHRTLFVLPGD